MYLLCLYLGNKSLLIYVVGYSFFFCPDYLGWDSLNVLRLCISLYMHFPKLITNVHWSDYYRQAFRLFFKVHFDTLSICVKQNMVSLTVVSWCLSKREPLWTWTYNKSCFWKVNVLLLMKLCIHNSNLVFSFLFVFFFNTGSFQVFTWMSSPLF